MFEKLKTDITAVSGKTVNTDKSVNSHLTDKSGNTGLTGKSGAS
jgi:hypothetical protein